MFEHMDVDLKNSFLNLGTINRQPINRRTGKRGILPKTVLKAGTIICPDAVVYAGTILCKNVFVADGASIRENCYIGDNTLIGRMSTIEQNTIIGKDCRINSVVHLTGNMIIGDNVFFGPYVTTMNDKNMALNPNEIMKGPIIGDNCVIGGGAILMAGIKIAHDVVIGAGALIIKDITKPFTVWGCKPAEDISHKTKILQFIKKKEKNIKFN